MRKRIFMVYLSAVLFILTAPLLCAEPLPDSTDYNLAQVLSFSISGTGENRFTFSVTLQHNDQGWDHYTDGWEILDADTGTVLVVRELRHPHVDEQPFTRSLSDIIIPSGTSRIIIRGKCNVHGYGGNSILFDTGNLPEEGQSLVME